MKRFFILLFFVLLSSLSFGQTWVKELPERGIPIKMYQTNDGGFLLAAVLYTDKFDGATYDAAIFKYDQNGNLIQHYKIVENDTVSSGIGHFIQMDNDSYLLIAGRSDSGNCYYKLNKDGSIIDTYYPISKVNPIRGVCYNSHIYGFKGYYLYKWDLTFHPIDSVLPNPNFVWQVKANKTGRILLSGPEDISPLPSYIYYRVYDPTFNLLHSVQYIDKDHISLSIDDGWVFHYKGLFKLNENLDSVWYHSIDEYRFSGTEDQKGIDLKQAPDGGYILCGEVWNPFFHTPYLIKTDSLGNLQWKEGYQSLANNVVGVEATSDGGYTMFASKEMQSPDPPRMFLIKTNNSGTLGVGSHYQSMQSIVIYPNPVQDILKVKTQRVLSGIVKVLNLTGTCVYESRLNNEEHVEVLVDQLPAGMYILQITDGSTFQSYYQKFIKQ